VSASGITDIEIIPDADTLVVNLDPISISVVPEADTLELNLDPISISVVPELTP
jgi:hypothetical protein